MKNKLREFRELLVSTDPDSAAKLQPGLSREVIAERLSRLPFRLSPDVVELYAWADGRLDDPLEILPGAYFVSLENAIDEFFELAPMRDELDDIFPQNYRDSFRFLSDFSDGGYAFGAVDSPANGAIVHLAIHEEWRLAFASLENMVDTAIECRKRGVFKTGADIPDFELYYRIGLELNPEMENWREGAEDGG